MDYLHPLSNSEPLKQKDKSVNGGAVGITATVVELLSGTQLEHIQFFEHQKEHVFRQGVRKIDVQGYLKLPSLTKTVYYAYVFLLSLFSVFLFGKSLLIKYAPTLTFGFFSKTGPTRQQLLEGSTKMTFYAEGWKNKSEESLNKHSTKPDSRLKLTITGPEPAYPFTAKCMVQAGLTLLKEQEKMPLKGGVLTPGVAFGKTTIQKRLEKSGLTFTLEDISCSV